MVGNALEVAGAPRTFGNVRGGERSRRSGTLWNLLEYHERSGTCGTVRELLVSCSSRRGKHAPTRPRVHDPRSARDGYGDRGTQKSSTAARVLHGTHAKPGGPPLPWCHLRTAVTPTATAIPLATAARTPLETQPTKALGGAGCGVPDRPTVTRTFPNGHKNTPYTPGRAPPPPRQNRVLVAAARPSPRPTGPSGKDGRGGAV